MALIFPEGKSSRRLGFDVSTKSASRTVGDKNSAGKRKPISSKRQPSAPTAKSKKLKSHQQMNYKFGQDSVMGGKISPASNNSWLDGLSPSQIVSILSPGSLDVVFQSWVATNFPTATDEKVVEQLRKFFDSVVGKYGSWLSSAEYSPNLDVLAEALTEFPGFLWGVSKFGCPMFVSISDDSKPRVFLDCSFNLIVINTAHATSSTPDSNYQVPKDSDLIDNSTAALVVHEWAHWMHNMAMRDAEFLGSEEGKIKNFFGSTQMIGYRKALLVADKYFEIEKPKYFGIDARSTQSAPAISTYFGHLNGSEMLAEAVVAYLHPNQSLKFSQMSEELRTDVETFLTLNGGKRPWIDSPLPKDKVTRSSK